MMIVLLFCSLLLHFGHLSVRHSSRGLKTFSSPYFSSEARTYQVLQGQSVTLHCSVKDLGDSTLIWKKDGRMISVNEKLIRKDERMSLVKQSLQISSVGVEDGGEYICNVETVGKPLDQVHTLDVLVPPQILRDPGRDGRATVVSGSRVVLTCSASGNPPPSITWSRLDGEMVGEVTAGEDRLEIARAGLHHAGLYQCLADNGLNQVDSLNIQLVVLYPPVISLSHHWTLLEDSLVLELLCQVEADPPSLISWAREGGGLTGRDNVQVDNIDSQYHKLTVDVMSESDLGNYSCTGENSVGRRREEISVSGEPLPAIITSPSNSHLPHSYSLHWTAGSLYPVTETRLLLREVGAGDWTNMIIPSVEISQASLVTYRLQFSLHNLEERTSYEVIIQTRNRAGWSPSSDIFVFTTSASRLAIRGQLFAQSASRGESVAMVPSVSYFIVFSIIIIQRADGNNIFS